MKALHISLLNGNPVVWCEGGSLFDALEAIGFPLPRSAPLSAMTLWLPGRKSVPFPSSSLLGEAEGRGKVALVPFRTQGRSPSTFAEAAALAYRFEGSSPRGSGVLFGSSVRWFAAAMRAVRLLTAGESVLPAAARTEGVWEARWIPAPDDSAQRLLEELAASMPHVCRSIASDEQGPPDHSPRRVLAAFLGRFVDLAMRGEERRKEEAPKGRKKKTASSDAGSLHDAWREALSGADARILWSDENELSEFARALSAWRRPVEFASKAAYRFCFRLEEPEEGDDWRLVYLVQPKADPSLLLPLDALWEQTPPPKKSRKKGPAPSPLPAVRDVSAEFLLTMLGQAAALSPRVAQSLKQPAPSSIRMSSEEAFSFLGGEAQTLADAGFQMMLPRWFVKGPGERIKVKAVVKAPTMQSASGMSLESVMEFDYALSLAGETLAPEELEMLVMLKGDFVRFRGQWMKVDRESIASGLRLFSQKKETRATGRDLLMKAVGGEGALSGVSVDSAELHGWPAELLAKLVEKRSDDLPSPEGLRGVLRPYQQRGYSWLAFLKEWGLGACLADDMGLGKSVQALALVQRERERGETRPALLVCPTSVMDNWRREAEKFTPGLSVAVHWGASRARRGDFAGVAAANALVVSSYALVQRDIAFLKEVEWAGVLLDEAQNVKNPEAKQSRAVRSLRSGYRVALTGTPVENHVGDLWSLMDFLNPGLLGSASAFKRRFHTPITRDGDTEAAERLRRATAPFILRRLKSDRSIISDLPDKIETKSYCPLTKEQASLYAAVLADIDERLTNSEGIERKGLVLAALTRLKQVCNHPAHFAGDGSALTGRSGKLERLMEMLEEARESGGRTLVFTQFAEMGELMASHIREYFAEEIFLLHGGVPKKKRDEMVARFQEDAAAPHVFILSLKAGGSGINLTRADRVIHYDRWWNPAVENQATDRAYRIGQTKNVQVYKFLVAGTLEEKIDALIERKSAIAGTIIGAGENWLTELSNGELHDLLALEKEAVVE